MKKTALTLLIVLLSAGLAFAQQQEGTEQQGQMGTEEMTTEQQGTEEMTTEQQGTEEMTTEQQGQLGAGELPETVTLQEVKGYTVQNTDGSIQGQVADAIITRDGMIPYIVIEVNQPSEYAGNQYLVPPMAAVMDTAQGLSTFDVSTSALQDMPTLADKQPQQMGEWNMEVSQFWQNMLGADYTPAEVQEAILASQLMNYTVQSQDGQDLGQIENIRVNVRATEISGVTVSEAGTLGVGPQGISMEDVQINPMEQTITVQMSQEMMGQQDETLGAGEETMEQQGETMGAGEEGSMEGESEDTGVSPELPVTPESGEYLQDDPELETEE